MISLVGMLMSCVDKIDLKPPSGLSDSVSINGRLVKDGDTAYAKIIVTNIFDFNAQARRQVVVNTPKLYNEVGDFVFLERAGISNYEVEILPNSGFDVEYGHTYFVEVELTDGRTYQSQPDILMPVPEIERFFWDTTSVPIINTLGQVNSDERLTLNVSTSVEETGSRPNVLWELDRTYKITDESPAKNECYINENPVTNRVKYLDTRSTIDGVITIEGRELAKLIIDRRITEGSLFELSQYSLSDEAVEYWQSVDQLLSKNGTMFDVPGSEIKTNFYNVDDIDDPVYGHFFVTEKEDASFKIDSIDFPEIFKFCDPRNPPKDFESECEFGCCGCLGIPGATLKRPAKW